MDSMELKLCDIQGRLFELAWKDHYNSERFIRYFMNSKVARSGLFRIFPRKRFQSLWNTILVYWQRGLLEKRSIIFKEEGTSDEYTSNRKWL